MCFFVVVPFRKENARNNNFQQSKQANKQVDEQAMAEWEVI